MVRRQFEQRYRRPATGRVLIAGSHVYADKPDRRKLYDSNDVVGVDLTAGPGVDVVADLEDWRSIVNSGLLTMPTARHFSHIECCSVLEHSRRPWRLAENLEDLMCTGSTLDLSVPFVWRYHSYGGDYFRFSADGVRELFPRIKWRALMYATSTTLTKSAKPKTTTVGDEVYFCRTEVLGFGVRE
jgi:hypothetical protein